MKTGDEVGPGVIGSLSHGVGKSDAIGSLTKGRIEKIVGRLKSMDKKKCSEPEEQRSSIESSGQQDSDQRCDDPPEDSDQGIQNA